MRIGLLLSMGMLVASGVQAEALGAIPGESGISGSVLAGASVGETKSNFATGSAGSERIDALGAAAQQRHLDPVINGDLRYTFASTGSQLFLGNLIQDAIRGDGTQQFGLRQQLGDKGIVAGSLVFNATPAKVWRDPFAVGVEREQSDVRSHGARLAWDNIWGSALSGSITSRDVKVDGESSGEQYGRAVMGMLDRNGRVNFAELSYQFRLTDDQFLEPALRYEQADLAGSAESYVSKGLQLTYAKTSPRWSFVSNLYLGKRDYDEANPLFGLRADSRDMAIDATLFWHQLFGIAPLSALLSASYANADSGIDFYDIRATSITTGLLYRF
ncbi:DUF2860 family protein [Aeromonas veronii]|uniref:DUF2860 family protein n=1 Tax=Aeromonas veronii TaxID=654 RepID=UPI001FD67604|nr:DUF2860 family protein [Aeromonas veronii]MCJ8234671.1 DUF2860 domain-containing protein [Aeromonas veronii]MCR3969902.1 DUF2860 domain-containing protein [Aeromonas veronii]MCR3973883.1 DUF2860 domain-containing protein [Aeromonas veronii]